MTNVDKKAELSQRWPHDAPYVWAPWKFSGVPDNARGYFSRIFNGLLLGWILWMYWPNLKSVAFPVPEIIRGTRKNWTVPGYAHAGIFSKIFHGLLFWWTLWMYWLNVKSVAFPVPGIIGGTRKIWAVPGYDHPPFSPKFLLGFCSDGPSECTSQIWNP